MEIQQQDQGALTVLSLRGNLSVEGAEKLRTAVLQWLADNRRDVVLDFNGLEFIDSRGLETLLWLQDRCGELLGQLRLARCPNHIRKVLEVTRLWSRFETHPDIDTAIASLDGAT